MRAKHISPALFFLLVLSSQAVSLEQTMRYSLQDHERIMHNARPIALVSLHSMSSNSLSEQLQEVSRSVDEGNTDHAMDQIALIKQNLKELEDQITA